MSNFICLRHCVQDKMQVSKKFTDKPRRIMFLFCIDLPVTVLYMFLSAMYSMFR